MRALRVLLGTLKEILENHMTSQLWKSLTGHILEFWSTCVQERPRREEGTNCSTIVDTEAHISTVITQGYPVKFEKLEVNLLTQNPLANGRKHTGKILWRSKWQPMPLFLPRESVDRGTWQAPVNGVTKSWTRLKEISTQYTRPLRKIDWWLTDH